MISPARNLTERGFEADFGVTVRPWMSLGVDFGILSGAGTINGTETDYAPALKQFCRPQSIHVAFKSLTYTFAAGPQFYLRKWQKVTFLSAPALEESMNGQHLRFRRIGNDLRSAACPYRTPIKMIPSCSSGLGGGFDLNVSRTVGFRFAADWVNTHLFSSLLTQRQNYVRFSVGPTFRWGKYATRANNGLANPFTDQGGGSAYEASDTE